MDAVFYDLTFRTLPGWVMTPRPATERLVARAAALAGERPLRVADVGTGSGAIAVALAVAAPRAHVWATDTSEAAVVLARLNARVHGVEARVHVCRGDLLAPIPAPLDLVVANLPYLPDALAGARGYEELGAEPAEAVFADGDGLGPYRRLLAQAEERLSPGGRVVIQLRRRVLEAGRDDLAGLRDRLAAHSE